MADAWRWDLYSGCYDLFLKMIAGERTHLFRMLALDPAVPLNVYIAGCGTGLDFRYLPAGSRIVALDFSDKMLTKARSAAAQTHTDVRLLQGRAELSELPDSSQDLVLLHLILAVTDSPGRLLMEALRVLKPNGIISVWDKFLREKQRVSRLRLILDKITSALGTTINLDFDALMAELPLEIVRREYRTGGLTQQIVLKRKRI